MIKKVTLPNLEDAADETPLLEKLDLDLVGHVAVDVQAYIGELRIEISELMSLKNGSVVQISAKPNDHIRLELDGKVIAFGELVVVGEHLGVRIVEIEN